MNGCDATTVQGAAELIAAWQRGASPRRAARMLARFAAEVEVLARGDELRGRAAAAAEARTAAALMRAAAQESARIAESTS